LSKVVVTALPEATVVSPVPPVKVIVSVLKSIAPEPLSPAKARSGKFTVPAAVNCP